jgi:hypothetical protein
MENPMLSGVRALWQEDEGALRDVYVTGARVGDWQRVIDAIREAGWQTSYSVEHETVAMPRDVRDVFAALARTAGLLWKIQIAETTTVNGHFYGSVDSDIGVEFDIEPREITDQQSLDAVCDFMRVIGRSVNKTVWLGVESSGSGRPPAEMQYDPLSYSIQLKAT